MINLRIDTSRLTSNVFIRNFSSNFKRNLISACNISFQNHVKEINKKIRDNVQAKLNIKRQAFVKSFTGKLYNSRTDRLPKMHFYSKVPWVGIHDKGQKISGKIFIPFSLKPIGFKKQKLIFDELRRNNNLFIDKSNGNKAILWSKNNQASKNILKVFKQFERQQRVNLRNSGQSVRLGIRRDERVNLGILVKSTKIDKKINFTEIINDNMSLVTRDVENTFIRLYNR